MYLVSLCARRLVTGLEHRIVRSSDSSPILLPIRLLGIEQFMNGLVRCFGRKQRAGTCRLLDIELVLKQFGRFLIDLFTHFQVVLVARWLTLVLRQLLVHGDLAY